MEYLNSETILRDTGIAQSTWSEEQNRLTQMGLLEKKQSRIMTSNVITRVMNYKLTDRGRLVAQNLSNISRILAPEQFSGAGISDLEATESSNEGIRAMDQKEVDEKILECIEIGLDSFGMNLDELVKSEFERSGDLRWEEVSRYPEKLEILLGQLFGTGGSTTIESTVAANIRSRFGLRSINSNRLSVLIAEIRLTSGRSSLRSVEEKETAAVI